LLASLRNIGRKLGRAFHLLPALRLVWQAAPGWTIAHVILILLQGLLPLPMLYLTKLIIDTVTLLPTGDRSAIVQHLVLLLALMGLTTLATLACNAAAELVSTAQAQRVTDSMHDVLHGKSIQVDLAFYENPAYRDTLQRAQNQGTYRPNQVLMNLVDFAQNGISLMAMAGLLLSLHWGIVGALLVAAVPSVWVRVRFTRVRHQWYRRRTALDRQGNYLSWLLIGDIWAKEIRLFNLGQVFRHRFNRIRQQLYGETLSITRRQAIAGFMAQAIAALLLLLAYGFMVYQTFQGVLKIGDLVLYHEALQRGQSALRGLLGKVSALYEDNLFLANLYEFLDLEPQIAEPEQPVPVPTPMRSGIQFHQVNFQYSSTSRQALHDINLTVRPGEVIALVGENGSGKTTLIKLLCRLYDPSSGHITLDGVDLRDYAIADLRRQISVIFQDYAKYYLTAQENIWLGNTELEPSSDRIPKAAFRSGADAVIQSLPQGYDTMLGQWFDRGEELSIGQWQKVALARAFLRDSQLIVLDEPTSAMDPQAEAEVFEQFRQLIQHQAAILISHRLSTVKLADRIYVIDQGRIIEQGTHSQLMQQAGTYAKLFALQADSYQMEKLPT
jgi:ATP-binding cassette, subfamily B, bacterial